MTMENSPVHAVRDAVGLRAPAEAVPVPTARHRRYHLLVIAIDEYTHWSKLRTAVRGAKALVQVLRRRYGVRAEDVVELLDEQATRRRIIAALERTSKALGDDDVWIVVFAGHGHLDDTLRTGAWIPVDCPPPDHGASAEWVSHAEVVAWLRVSKARQVLLIADSCFAGELLGGTRAMSEEPTPEQIARWGEARSRRALTSGGNEPVYDGRPDGHSVFMGPLLERLESAELPVFHSGQLCDWVDRSMSGLPVPQRPCEGPLPEAGDDSGGRFLLRRSAEDAAFDVREVEDASPSRRRWAGAWNQLRAIRGEEERLQAGTHFVQSEPSRELLMAKREWEEAERQRDRTRPAEWQDAALKQELEALVAVPNVSFADVREHARKKGSMLPTGLPEWWAALKKERAARLAVEACEQKLRQVTESRCAETEARRGEAEKELAEARIGLAEDILGAEARARGLGADGSWPSGEARRGWLKAGEESLPDSDPELADTLVDRADAVLAELVWAGASAVGTPAALRSLLENLTADLPEAISAQALARLHALDRDAAASARATGTPEAWDAYLSEFREVAGPGMVSLVSGQVVQPLLFAGEALDEARAWIRQYRWTRAQPDLGLVVGDWWQGTWWPTEELFETGWTAWLTANGLEVADVPEGWAEAAWKAVDAVAWSRVTEAGTGKAHEAYLQGRPDRCFHGDEARAWLANATERERVAADDAAWDAARGANTAEAFRQYVTKWPGGRHLAACAVAWAALPLPPVAAPSSPVQPPTPTPPATVRPTAPTAKPRGSGWTWVWGLAAVGCAVWAAVVSTEVWSERRTRERLSGELGTDPGVGTRQVSGKIGDVFRTDIGMELLWIPAGTFRMGSSDGVGHGDERPQTEVTISRPFWMGRFEVRQRDWKAVMGDDPSHFKGEDLPVESVDWNQSVEFGRKLTERMKGRIPEGYEFRLPTEAEWEYACRAGTTTLWSFGDAESELEKYGWFSGNSERKTHPVGEKLPNPWGLYEMHGGVLEWCLDWSGAYPGGRVTDPKGAANGSFRVIRGGSFSDSAGGCRSACRNGDEPGFRWSLLGFRLVLAPRSGS